MSATAQEGETPPDLGSGLMRHGQAGRWWRFVARESWPQDEQGLGGIMAKWDAAVGDCRQELVFIGQRARLRRELDACLLNDAELSAGPVAWALLEDPFAAA